MKEPYKSPLLISSLDWTTYYSKIFSSQDPAPILKNLPSDLLPWPPVSRDNVIKLIHSLKRGKSPGPDGISNDLLINNAQWWVDPLANLFTLIDEHGFIPEDWLTSILVPIFKKGNPSNAGNYRPISLLSAIGKLYSKHLLVHLATWSSVNPPGYEQIGFHSGCSTLDHALTLSFLAE